ncbi:hypothetical protein AC622_10950 [Bacillus sp. FJAT-27916]|uniref:DUF418 domain-containing protein n=1 Tax=Bacillus sp. FJAT-27916 TaxID=1679169 RepID=UPI0006712AAF|nr:DUF418 domain-containing protein [Bacillus sp. FJAT-27916]KMY44698.1 hypothetical protein AC622_10950 [Bacillus sp. FJAT-27916]
MSKGRVTLLDSLRGFSLLGILMANLLIFQFGLWGKDLIDTDELSKMDWFSVHFVKIVFEYSFMPIFSLLFGYSLVKLAEAINEKRDKSRWHLVRRAFGLMTLGMLHATFIWDGDILFYYGVMVLVLLPFLYRKPKTILIWAGITFILFTAGSYGDTTNQFETPEMLAFVQKTDEVYANGSYTEIREYNENAIPPILEENPLLLLGALLLSPFVMMPMFLIGMVMAKQQWFADPSSQKSAYRHGWWLIPIGITLKLLSHLEGLETFSGVFSQSGGQLLAFGYVLAFAHLYAQYQGGFLFRAFESMGKLSLTNYLMQSVIMTLVFYEYGLGYYQEISFTASVLLGILVFSVQCACSFWYLQYVKRGPVEYLLRVWTNLSWRGKVKEIKSSGSDAA